MEYDSVGKLFKSGQASVEKILDFLVQKEELDGNWKESDEIF